MIHSAQDAKVRQGQIFDIARANYRVLVDCCLLLSEEGYWKKPEEILHQSIYEVLDLYLQSALVWMAVYGNTFYESERQFILAITNSGQLHFPLQGEVEDEILERAVHFAQSPSVILQLCGLRDQERGTDLTGSYFDSLINILVAMSWLHENREAYIVPFMKEFYQSVEAFLILEKRTQKLDERYLFRKVSGDPQLPADVLPSDRGLSETEPDAMPEDAASGGKEQPEQEQKPVSQLDRLLMELEELVGLREVKAEIQSLINLIKIRTLRQERGLPAMEMSYHMVFTGSPGTGKTTVARLVAKIYKELGLLSKGTLVETDRSGLVAGYVGQTALKVKEVVDRAIGGVLFIDEAYSLAPFDLCGAGTNDFGREAIDTLVKLMEDYRDNLVVIVAGYTEEMKHFLASNTGLVSRFNKFIPFQDYTEEELVAIFVHMADKMKMTVDEKACRQLCFCLSAMDKEERRRFGNARGVRNLFEKAIVCQANRLVGSETAKEPTIEELSEEELSEIRWRDLEQAFYSMVEKEGS